MNLYTVIFTHELGGVPCAFHLERTSADNAADAAARCKQAVGGYARIIVVLEGHHTPVLAEPNLHQWDS